jgi:putative membrane protein
MQLVSQAVLHSWSVPPVATFLIALSALTYLRGWWLLRQAGSPSVPQWRAWSFLLGLFSLWVALASPMDLFNSFVLTAHMLQHMMLMMVAPPLLLLGAPLVPLVRGLPVFAAREFAGPFLNWSVAKRVGSKVTHPVFALVLMGVTMFAWHIPVLYELALRSEVWHQVEHACFLITSLIFWWPVIQPWPSKATWPRWAMVPYLLVADLQNTVLSAILAFSDRVIYPSYSIAPRIFRFSALEDQVAAGAIMWVVGSLAFVVPAVVIAVQCLSRKPSAAPVSSLRRHEASSLDFFLPQGSFRARLLPACWKGQPAQAGLFVLVYVVACLCLLGLLTTGSDDDDGLVLRFKGSSSAFAVAVFAPPGSLAAGPSPFNVLVQDRNTRETLLDTTVDLSAEPSDFKGPPVEGQASHEDSANKLLQAADLDLHTEGDWILRIRVRRGNASDDFLLPLRVAEPDAGSTNRWPYLGILLFSAALLSAYIGRRGFWKPPLRASPPFGSS